MYFVFLGVHPVRRKEALWCVHPVHGLGQALWLPAGTFAKLSILDLVLKLNFTLPSLSLCFPHPVPVRSLWQLWWVESNLHWKQLECCCLYAQAGVQGWREYNFDALRIFTRRN